MKYKFIIIFIIILIIGLAFLIFNNFNKDKIVFKNSKIIKISSKDYKNDNDIIYSSTSKDEFLNNSEKHWWHMPVTYVFFKGVNEKNFTKCSDNQIERLKMAFEIIKNSTNGSVKFKEEKIYGDIFIFCYNASKPKEDHIVEGEAKIKIIKNVIAGGEIYFYSHLNCGGWPDTEIHEILHLFGYEHVKNNNSIMNPESKICDLNKIDKEIINDLNKVYS